MKNPRERDKTQTRENVTNDAPESGENSLYTTLAFAAGNVGLVSSTPSHVDGTARKSSGVRWFTGKTA